MRSAGKVTVLGEDPADGDEDWRSRIGMVLPSWRGHKEWRVRQLLDQLRSFYQPYRNPWDIDELIDAVGLIQHRTKRIKQLSGGQRRRLDLAIGIVAAPDLLFLDEPTAGFDPSARREFHDLVHRLSDLQQTTILLTTHDLDEAEKLADRILILAGDRIIAERSADELSRRVEAESEVQWRVRGSRHVHFTAEPTSYGRKLFEQHGEELADLEVRRATLGDTYMTLVQAFESGEQDADRGVAAIAKGADDPMNRPHCPRTRTLCARAYAAASSDFGIPSPISRTCGASLPERDPADRAAVHAQLQLARHRFLDGRGHPSRCARHEYRVRWTDNRCNEPRGGAGGRHAAALQGDPERNARLSDIQGAACRRHDRDQPGYPADRRLGGPERIAPRRGQRVAHTALGDPTRVDRYHADGRGAGVAVPQPAQHQHPGAADHGLGGHLRVFYPIREFPEWLPGLAQVFPMYWLGLGTRLALLPDDLAAVQIGESWRHPQTVGVLGVWVVVGFILAPAVLRRMARRESGSAVTTRREKAMQSYR